jgi:hypothetical protein
VSTIDTIAVAIANKAADVASAITLPLEVLSML